ncbi:unnamed protein product [Porites evermanni]|uniref:3-oxo-5-alpha-steroid 4-dehydrogenase C-terminal domain-containing protein n=1 Tax=Porites evermanni TaxID=104178 RepID=A0ABN8LIY0_9CNID|nr:unnamed protein product [Porites evermanni]
MFCFYYYSFLSKGGKSLKDEDKLESFDVKDGGRLYVKDLARYDSIITVVFLTEYASPLIFYVLLYPHPSIVYGAAAASKPYAPVVHIAAACWAGHFANRLLETLFVHRFSHATMPLSNLFKNCAYYGGYSVLVGYFVNHPLYTPPMFGDAQVCTSLALFLFNEYGNFAIHCALWDLRPPGAKERKIPYPTSHPLTQLFRFVSCPNYTYEVKLSRSQSILPFDVILQHDWPIEQCLLYIRVFFGGKTKSPSVLFTLFGFYQMAVWAIGKHRNYRKEFEDYPKGRKAVVPFLL